MDHHRAEPPLAEAEYQAIEAALLETARGRWFLAEYARRRRTADTDLLLVAIERLEQVVLAGPAATRETGPVAPAPGIVHGPVLEPSDDDLVDDLFDADDAPAWPRADGAEPRFAPSPELIELRAHLRHLP